MADEGQDRPGQGEILSFLRWFAGLTQDALALLSRTDRSQISRYEQGENPQPATLQRILAALKARPRFVVFLRWWLRLIRKAHALEQAEELPTREAGWQRETRSAVWGFVDRAVALARVELAILRSAPPAGQPSHPTDRDHLRVEQLWQRLASGARHPRLRFGIRFNQAANLLLLGRAEKAAPIVEEVRHLAAGLGNDLDSVKTLWLEANLDAGLGKRREALDGLEEVRRGFEERKLPYDYALASLDAALLYREEGRWPEIQALAQEILKIFRAQGVQREAVAAVLLFQEAAAQERVTAGLVRRLQDFLLKAQSNPKLRFKEGPPRSSGQRG